MFEAEVSDAKCHLPFNNFYTLSCQSETVWTSLIEIVRQKVRTAHLSGCQPAGSRSRPGHHHSQQHHGAGGRLERQTAYRMPHGNHPSCPPAKAPSGLWAKTHRQWHGPDTPAKLQVFQWQSFVKSCNRSSMIHSNNIMFLKIWSVSLSTISTLKTIY